jgi:outer membrane protein
VVVPGGGFGSSLDQVGSFSLPTYGVSLNLRLPIRNRAANADLGSALIAKKSSLYQLRLRQQQINQDIRSAIHQLEASKLGLSAAGTSRDLARKTLAAEERKYQLGAQPIFFVLDAQNSLASAEQSYVQAQIDYQRAIALVDRVTGNLLLKNQILVGDLVQ